MLNDLSSLLKRNDDVTEEELQHAAYALLSRQFLHHNKPRQRKQYNHIVRFQKYFSYLMTATNHDLVINENQRYVGIVPQDYINRLRIDETLFLLSLRAIYDEEIIAFHANDDGSINISLDDFEMRYEQLTGRILPKVHAELESIMKQFQHFGVIEYGPDEDRPEFKRILILPTIAALLSGEAIKRIEIYLKDDNVSFENPDNNEEDESEESAS